MSSSQRLSSLTSHSAYDSALEIIQNLHKNGFQAMFAGGCVRDALLGKPPKDLDIATSARPSEVETLFANTLSVGKDFGVIVVVTDFGPIEVASFRSDGPYEDGRRPSSIQFTNAKEDALRRDFTINALFYDPIEQELFDFVGGVQDLKLKIIRAVGDPVLRFQEDKLRMLRAVRFLAQLGFAVEEKTELAISQNASEINQVSKERLFNEMHRLLGSAYWIKGLLLLKRTGLANYIWPELSFSQYDLKQFRFEDSREWELSFCAINVMIDAEMQAEARLYSWGAPKKSIRRVLEIFENSARVVDEKSTRAQRIRAIGSDQYAEVLAIARLRLAKQRKSTQVLSQWIGEYLAVTGPSAKMPAPLVSGADLIQIGFSADKKLGEILKLLYDEQLELKFSSKLEGLRLAKTLRQA